MMVSILLLIAVNCMVIAVVEINEEREHERMRRSIRENRSVACVPLDAAERLKAFLKSDKSADKEYKLAALVVEDSDGHVSIEDVDLRGDSAEPIRLSDFAYKRYKNMADKFLFDFNIIDTISNKVHSCIGDTEMYHAFQITKENVVSGRHGKTRRNIAKDFVVFLDLSERELRQIANLSF